MAHLARPLWQYPQVSSPGDGLPVPLLDRQRRRRASSSTRPTGWSRSTTTSRPRTSSSASIRTWPGLCHHGRRELAAFAPRTELALGDSEFNRRELEAAGFARTGVLPIVLDLDGLRRPRLAGGRARSTATARTQHPLRRPHHPQQEDRRPDPRLRALPAPRRAAAAACCWSATTAATSATTTACRSWCASCASHEVVFTGHVDDDELLAYYAAADLFLCLSEHEGFCVPLLEAMVFGLPVVAYDAGAVRGDAARRRRAAARRSSRRVVAELAGPRPRRRRAAAGVLATQAAAMRCSAPRAPRLRRAARRRGWPRRCSRREDRPVGARAAPRRRHRRLRAADARRLPLAGGTRPTSTRSSWTTTSRATAAAAPTGGRAARDGRRRSSTTRCPRR